MNKELYATGEVSAYGEAIYIGDTVSGFTSEDERFFGEVVGVGDSPCGAIQPRRLHVMSGAHFALGGLREAYIYPCEVWGVND